MFDFSWGELILIGAVALIVIGPKELPGVLRAIGHWTAKIRRMAAEFQGQFQEAMREAEMADLKREIDTATRPFTSPFDPVESKEGTKWEPKPGQASESSTGETDGPTQPAATVDHTDGLEGAAAETAGSTQPSEAAPAAEPVGPSAHPLSEQAPHMAAVSGAANSIQSVPSEAAASPVAPAASGGAIADAVADPPAPQRSERS